MDLSNRVTQLEDEIKVLKNELLAVLLDVKEELLARENPFQQHVMQSPQMIAFSQAAPSPGENSQPRRAPEKPEEPPIPDKEVQTQASVDESSDEPAPPAIPPRRSRTEPPLASMSSPSVGNVADDLWVDELVKSWKPVEAGDMKGNGESAANGHGVAIAETIGANISLATLSGLAGWVSESATHLGAGRIQTILDISEMMGDIPSELKLTLDKLVPHNGAEVDSEQIPAQTYLSSLKRLASLLGKENTNDFVVMHMVSHGLNSRHTSGK